MMLAKAKAKVEALIETDFYFLKWLAIITTMIVVLTIALFTSSSLHPDEGAHIGGFEYFQGRVFPPDIGTDGVVYSGYGQSRVFSKEIVYIIYGNLAFLLTKVTGIQTSYLTYRLLNVGLLWITLLIVFFTPVRPRLIPLFGFVFVSIPQLYYLYAYANSDAWAVSWSIFIFIFAVHLWDQEPSQWQLKDWLILGLLTGMILVAKANFLVSLILPYSLIGWRVMTYLQQQKYRLPASWQRHLVVWLLVLLIIAGPLQIIYPLSQGNYKAAIDRTREERAIEGFKPSNPLSRGLHLKAKGYSYDHLFKRHWLQTTSRSFWGLLGVKIRPRSLYKYLFYGVLGLISLTLFTLMQTTALLRDRFLTLCFPISVIVLLLNIYGSLRYSLYFDFQPQGRYIFPSFIPICFLLVGTAPIDSLAIRLTRGLICTCLYSFGLYSCLFIIIPQLLLRSV